MYNYNTYRTYELRSNQKNILTLLIDTCFTYIINFNLCSRQIRSYGYTEKNKQELIFFKWFHFYNVNTVAET